MFLHSKAFSEGLISEALFLISSSENKNEHSQFRWLHLTSKQNFCKQNYSIFYIGYSYITKHVTLHHYITVTLHYI